MNQDGLTSRQLPRRNILQIGGATALLAGCGRLTGSETKTPSGGTKTIRVAVFGASQSVESRKQMVQEFEAAHKDLKVDLVPIQGKDWNDFFTKILTQVASGNAPDLVEVATEGTQLFASRLAAPLDDYVKNDKNDLREYFTDVHPSLTESMMYEGSLYSLPFKFNAANIIYSKTLFQKAGLATPAANWTVEDFSAAAAAISRTAKSRDTSPFYWANSLFGGLLPWMFVNGSNLLTEERAPGGEWLWGEFYPKDAAGSRGGGWRWTTPIANDPKNIEALQFVRDLVARRLAPAPEQGASVSVQGLFASGAVGMAPGGGSWAGGLANAGMASDAFDVQFFPRWRTQRHQFGASGYMIMKSAKDKDSAWEFLKYSVSKPALESVTRDNSTTPARRSLLTADRYSKTGPSNWRAFYDTLDRFPDTGPLPAPPKSNEITSAFTQYVGLGANGSLSPKQALDQMQQALEGILKK